MYLSDLNTVDRYPALLRSVHQRRADPTARTTSSVLNSTTIVLGATSPVDQESRPSGGSPRINGSQNAINTLVNPRSASLSETERVGEPAGGLAVGRGEWGDNESVREKRLKERLKKWKRDDKLVLVGPLPSLSRQTCHLLTMILYGMGCSHQQVVSTVLRGVVSSAHYQQCSPVQPRRNTRAHLTFAPPPAFRHRSSSTDGTDEPMAQDNFSAALWSSQSEDQGKVSWTSRGREISGFVVRMAVGSVGDTLSPLPSLRATLGQAEGGGVSKARRTDLDRM